MVNPPKNVFPLSVGALFLHISSVLYLVLIPFHRSGTRRGSPFISISIISHLSFFPLIILYLNPHPPPPPCFSGKGLRCRPCTFSWWLYLSLFAQKPQQQKREWKHRQPKHPHTNAAAQVAHVHMVASRSFSDTHYQTHTDTHTKNVSLIFTHTFPLHRPVVHFQYSPFLFPAVRQCDRTPCGRGATCEEAPGGYRCLCPPEWTGRTCQLGQWVTIIMCIYVLLCKNKTVDAAKIGAGIKYLREDQKKVRA